VSFGSRRVALLVPDSYAERVSRSLARVLAAWIAVAGVPACTTAPRAVAPASAASRVERPLPAAARQLRTAAATVDRAAPPELFVRCEARANCPNGVGMLVVDSDARLPPERCTAALIAPDRAVTASHCIAPSDRRTGASCARTWVLFPETDDAPAEWVGCAQIVYAAEVVGSDALRQEHAVLQLARAVGRTPLAINPAPPEPGSIVTVVSVTPHPVYDTTHAVSARLCRAIDATHATEALGAAAASVGWLASCPVEHGNSGSPVLDYAGEIRAIVHGGTSVISAFAVTSSLSR